MNNVSVVGNNNVTCIGGGTTHIIRAPPLSTTSKKNSSKPKKKKNVYFLNGLKMANGIAIVSVTIIGRDNRAITRDTQPFQTTVVSDQAIEEVISTPEGDIVVVSLIDENGVKQKRKTAIF